MASDSYDTTRDPRTGRPPLPIEVEKSRAAKVKNGGETPDGHETSSVEVETAVADLDQPGEDVKSPSRKAPPEENDTDAGQRPEALAQFAQSARDGETSPKELEADAVTAPIATGNSVKHEVATTLLNEGAHGGEPDPDAAGEDRLPDRIARTAPRTPDDE